MNNDVNNNSVIWEINFKDLFWKVLFSWRFIIVGIIVVAIAVTVWDYNKALQEYEGYINQKKEEPSVATATLEELRQSLTEDEKNALYEVETVKKQLLQKIEYKNNSLYMQLDANAIDSVTMSYYIDTDYEINLNGVYVEDKASVIRDAYIHYLQSKSFQSELVDLLNYKGKEQYLNELITSNFIDGSDTIFYIHVYGLDEEHANEIADGIAHLIEKYKEKLQVEISDFDLKLLNRNTEIIIDSNVRTHQEGYENTIISFSKTLSTLESQLNKKQWQIYNDSIISTDESTENQNIQIEFVKPSINVYMIIIGAILGVFLSAIFVIMKYIFTSRLRNADELSLNFGLYELGKYIRNRKNVIDRILNSLRYGTNSDKDLDYLILNVKSVCEQNGLDKICFVSTIKYSNDTQNMINEIITKVEQSGIKIISCPNIFEDIEAYEKMLKNKNVLLVEKETVSHYAKIEKLLSVSNKHNINVLGYIGI